MTNSISIYKVISINIYLCIYTYIYLIIYIYIFYLYIYSRVRQTETGGISGCVGSVLDVKGIV